MAGRSFSIALFLFIYQTPALATGGDAATVCSQKGDSCSTTQSYALLQTSKVKRAPDLEETLGYSANATKDDEAAMLLEQGDDSQNGDLASLSSNPGYAFHGTYHSTSGINVKVSGAARKKKLFGGYENVIYSSSVGSKPVHRRRWSNVKGTTLEDKIWMFGITGSLRHYGAVGRKIFWSNGNTWTKPPTPTPPPALPVMTDVEGGGYCKEGYYGGNCKQGDPSDEDVAACASFEACKAQCAQEEECKFVAFKTNVCSRYDDRAGDCTDRKHLGSKHKVARKD